MIEKYDEIELEISKCIESDIKKAKELNEVKKIILGKMSNEEINNLLQRPYPSQYKEILKKHL